MHAEHVMTLLEQACTALEQAGDHAAAAYVGHAMELVAERHGVALPPGKPPCGGDAG